MRRGCERSEAAGKRWAKVGQSGVVMDRCERRRVQTASETFLQVNGVVRFGPDWSSRGRDCRETRGYMGPYSAAHGKSSGVGGTS